MRERVRESERASERPTDRREWLPNLVARQFEFAATVLPDALDRSERDRPTPHGWIGLFRTRRCSDHGRASYTCSIRWLPIQLHFLTRPDREKPLPSGGARSRSGRILFQQYQYQDTVNTVDSDEAIPLEETSNAHDLKERTRPRSMVHSTQSLTESKSQSQCQRRRLGSAR